MEILKDFLSQMPMIWRIVVYVIGIVFWTWFVFLYPTNMSKDSVKDNSPAKSQPSIGRVEGDYVGRDKNVINLYKTEPPLIKKIEQYPKYKTAHIKKGYLGTYKKRLPWYMEFYEW